MSAATSRDGTRIGYEQAGTGPVLILVDPAGSFRALGAMRPLGAQLESRFTVVTYDRRGRGESTDTRPYAVDREVEDLQALIDACGGSAFVFGFSSGAVLALHAALHGLSMPKLALLEPPLSVDGKPVVGPDRGAEIAALVAAGRRGEAVEHFQRRIGVPAEMIAPTLVYDTIIPQAFPVARLSAITTSTLVLASEGTDNRLRSGAEGLGRTLPNAVFRALKGGWHGVPPEVLAPVLAEFFIGR